MLHLYGGAEEIQVEMEKRKLPSRRRRKASWRESFPRAGEEMRAGNGGERERAGEETEEKESRRRNGEREQEKKCELEMEERRKASWK